MRKAVLACTLLVVSGGALAGTDHEVSAVCRSPSGYQIRFDTTGKDTSSGKDGFTDVQWSFFWNSSKPAEGLTVTQDTASMGGRVVRQNAVVLTNQLPDMLTFIDSFSDGLWIYTLYPKAHTLVATRHGTGFKGEGGVGGVFRAACQVSIT